MRKFLARLIFFVLGWKIKGKVDPEMKKFVLIAAPHTSNWDFVLGACAWTLFNMPVRFLIKKEWFSFPMGGLIKSLGGIAVDKEQTVRLLATMVEVMKSRDEIVIALTPEGTRKKVKHWKMGFYHLALKSGVPIVLGKYDYKAKEVVVGSAFMPSGDVEKDFDIIREFYKNPKAKNPDGFNIEGIKPS